MQPGVYWVKCKGFDPGYLVKPTFIKQCMSDKKLAITADKLLKLNTKINDEYKLKLKEIEALVVANDDLRKQLIDRPTYSGLILSSGGSAVAGIVIGILIGLFAF